MKTKTIKQHEDKYWHIPKLSLLPLLGLIVFSLLAVANFNLINHDVLVQVFLSDFCSADLPCSLTSSDLINIYPIIGEYILISLALISLFAFLKGGYKNLKSYKEGGLILGLIAGLIWGLIGGLIAGLITGLIWGLIFGLIAGLIVGLIVGLIAGLILGLICGLIWE